MDPKWLTKVQKEFENQSRGTGRVDIETFKKALNLKETFFAERIFKILDKTNTGGLTLQEWIVGMTLFHYGTNEEKLQLLFQVYDVHNKGYLDFSAVRAVLASCVKESRLDFTEERIDELAEAVMQEACASKHRNGKISFEEFSDFFKKYPGVIEKLSISGTNWLQPIDDDDKKTVSRNDRLNFLQNKLPVVIFWFIIFVINVIIIVERAIRYVNNNALVTGWDVVARCCGAALNFNISLLIALMLRNSLTWIRSTRIAFFLPIDKHIKFHKYVGIIILLYSVIHTGAHIGNFLTIESPVTNFTAVQYLFTAEPGIGWVAGSASITGWILLLMMIPIYIGVLPIIRKRKLFEVFYFTHLLWIPWIFLVFLHGPNFWKWFLAPFILLVCERIYKAPCLRSVRHGGKTYVQEGVLLPSKVTHLVINRPENFKYNPGDYLFINIPKIARFEWHPFTISSAPEQKDVIWLHIRSVGTWTNGLYDFFEARRKKWNKCSKMAKRASRKAMKQKIMITPAMINAAQQELTNHVDIDMEKRRLSSSAVDVSLVPSSPVDLLGYKPFMSDVQVDSAIEEESEPSTGPSTPDINRNSSNQVFDDFPRPQIHPSPESCQSIESVKNPIIQDRHLVMPDTEDHYQNKAYEWLGEQTVPETSQEISYQAMRNGRNEEWLKRKMSLDPSNTSQSYEDDSVLSTSALQRRSHEDRRSSAPANIAKVYQQQSTLQRRMSKWGSVSRGQNFGHLRNKPFVYSMAPTDEEKLDCDKMKQDGLEVLIDGPYGAPSTQIFHAEHAVLVGAGIGVTPFASILQSIMLRYRTAKQCCPNCDHRWTAAVPQTLYNLKKVDFYWVSRDQKAFEWFQALLSQLEIEQSELGSVLENFLDINVYLTAALKQTDVKATLLQMAIDLIHRREAKDVITGLRTRTQAGRPDWNEIFQKISQNRKGKVTVFFCGAPAMGQVLKTHCDKYGFGFRKENF